MNVLDLTEMLEGIIHTLDEEVGPHVEAGHARAQLFASVDLLNNLSSKLDWKREILRAETDSIEDTLATVTTVWEGAANNAGELSGALKAATELQSDAEVGRENLSAWCRRCNEVLEQIIAALNAPHLDSDEVSSEMLTKARAAVHQHLVNQTIRDSMYLKPMMLKKISQG